MPTYDYKCKDCGFTFEEFQSMNADLLITCPSCGKPALVRLMAGGVGLVFKGSGFYHTDYKKSGASTSSNNKKSESSASKDKSEKLPSPDASKSETKPAPSSSPPPKSE